MKGINILRVDPSKLYQHKAIVNAKSHKVYQLVPMCDIAIASEAASQIATVCNEPRVYAWLFQDKLRGLSYHPERAKVFLEWAHDGWQQQSYFAFMILYNKNIVGAIDIKSADLQAEIGYWLSHLHSGVMTSAVKTIQDLAKEARYQGLFAYTAVNNLRSAAVLKRAGFRYSGQEEKNGQTFQRYDFALSSTIVL